MNSIRELSEAEKPDYNQIVRWVQNKEHHADELTEIVTYYFMAQRIKPADASDSEAHKMYLEELELAHRIMTAAMKAKQTTDLKAAEKLSSLTGKFEKIYNSNREK